MDKVLFKRSTFFLGTWLCTYGLAFSQHFNFTNYSVDNGLPQSEVLSIIQDDKHYLWLGTNGGGISKFDGHTFINYSEKEGLSNNIVHALCEDKRSNIWAGTEDGLSKFDRKKFTRYTIKDGLANNKIFAIFSDSKQRIWCGTASGLSCFNGSKFISFFTNGLSGNSFHSILEDNKGQLWFASEQGLMKFDGKKFTYYPLKDSLLSINSIMLDKEGNIWGALYGGAFVFTNGEYKYYSTSDGLSSNHLYTVCQDLQGNVWFGSDADGATMFNGKEVIHYTNKQGLNGNRVRSIICDKEGNIWFAAGLGISKYRASKFVNYTREDGLVSNVVDAITQDEKGNMWFGTQEGLTKFDGKTYKSYTTKDGLAHNRIWDVFEDRKGVLWLSTCSGISKIEGKKITNILPNHASLLNNVVYAVAHDHKENIWFGTSCGLCCYDGKKMNCYGIKEGLPANAMKIRCLLVDKRENIWIGSREGGLIKFDGHSFKAYTEKDGLGKNMVNQMVEDKFGNLWIATYGGGLSKLNPYTEKFTTITTQNNLLDNALLSIVFDDNGSLWIGGLKGIDQFNVGAYNATGQVDVKHYTKEDGYRGIECVRKASFKDKEGNIWFGTIAGAIKIDVNKKEPPITAPVVHINDIKLFLKRANSNTYVDTSIAGDFETLPKKLLLPYNQNHITFSYSGICFSAPLKVFFQYKLEGLDKRWSPATKETFVTYPSLPPGKYTFLVRASNNESSWISSPEKYSFLIRPPFWQRWWFYLLITSILLCGLLVFLLFFFTKEKEKKRGLNKQILQQKAITSAILEAQEQERKRIAVELHDGLGQVFAAIKLNLSAIEPMVEGFEVDKKDNYETSISLVDHAVKELRNISHAMLPHHLNDLGLVTALKVLCKNIQQSNFLECHFISSGVKTRLDKPIEIALYRICQELISNIVKHANASEMTIQLIKHDESIVMMVEDNGNGFKTVHYKKTNDSGIGLENIKSRIRLLNGTFTIDSNAESGTSVVVEIPLNYLDPDEENIAFVLGKPPLND